MYAVSLDLPLTVLTLVRNFKKRKTKTRKSLWVMQIKLVTLRRRRRYANVNCCLKMQGSQATSKIMHGLYTFLTSYGFRLLIFESLIRCLYSSGGVKSIYCQTLRCSSS